MQDDHALRSGKQIICSGGGFYQYPAMPRSGWFKLSKPQSEWDESFGRLDSWSMKHCGNTADDTACFVISPLSG